MLHIELDPELSNTVRVFGVDDKGMEMRGYTYLSSALRCRPRVSLERLCDFQTKVSLSLLFANRSFGADAYPWFPAFLLCGET